MTDSVAIATSAVAVDSDLIDAIADGNSAFVAGALQRGVAANASFGGGQWTLLCWAAWVRMIAYAGLVIALSV